MTTAPTYQFAELNGTQFHYDTCGSGPALVLIHSGVSDLRFWNDQVALFAQQYRVVRYDVRGAGKTPFGTGGKSGHDDLRALLEYLGIDKTMVMGCSVGGGIAIDFAQNYPERTSALIPVAAAVGGYEPEEVESEDKSERKKLNDSIEKAYAAGDLYKAADLYARVWMDGPKRTPDQVDPAVRAKAVEMMVTLFELPEDEDENFVELEPDAASRLSEIEIPTLVIVGDHDVERLIHHSDFIARKIPGAQKVVMRGVAHYPNMEKPAEFNRIVQGFLNEQR